MELARCEIVEKVATITLDDGHQNVISPSMLKAIHRALDQAEEAGAVVVLTGREEVFCAGFDLKILKRGVRAAFSMLTGGFALSQRLLSFPTPVVIACNGHAIAMGAFLLLSGDYRLGATGDFKLVTNEVAIGLTMPQAGVEICRQRLAPAHFVRAALLAEKYDPETAVDSGFLDGTTSPQILLQEAQALARQYAQLDLEAHRQTKLRARRDMLMALKRARFFDRIDFVLKGIARLFSRK